MLNAPDSPGIEHCTLSVEYFLQSRLYFNPLTTQAPPTHTQRNLVQVYRNSEFYKPGR